MYFLINIGDTANNNNNIIVNSNNKDVAKDIVKQHYPQQKSKAVVVRIEGGYHFK